MVVKVVLNEDFDDNEMCQLHISKWYICIRQQLFFYRQRKLGTHLHSGTGWPLRILPQRVRYGVTGCARLALAVLIIIEALSLIECRAILKLAFRSSSHGS